ncbi:MAG: Flp family type IVb pilin [Proteobacteria bacterium]|nr:Flp family type IVb pilin [Pseudomonadota bacterium]MCH7957992.1 Flp family type IVb pilin [Pseudomonadota bacterium]
MLTRIIEDQSGATAIEYALIAALVSVAAIGVLTSLGTALAAMFTFVATTLTTAVGG